MGLSTSDIQVIEKTLAAGKRPRVVFTDVAGQIAGQVGKVMRLGEPAEDDFVTVQFGHDELPFSAAEVRLPGRGELSRASRKAPAPQETAPAVQQPPPPEQRHNSGGDSRNRSAQMNDPQGPAEPRLAQAGTPPPDVVRPAPRKKPAAKSKGGPEITVTLQFKDDEWTVAAAKGSKVVARPLPVKPSLAVTMVRSLESPAVAAIVEEIVEQARASAAAEADQLRAQLAELEARLAELS